MNYFMGRLSMAALLASSFSVTAADESKQNWPQWRGPLGTGVAPMADPPLTWSEASNVTWKVKIPGDGSATPIVWGDRIFILTAIPTDKKSEAKAGTTTANARQTDGARSAGPGPGSGPPPGAGSDPGRPPGPGPGQGSGRGPGPGRGGFGSETPNEAYQFAVLC